MLELATRFDLSMQLPTIYDRSQERVSKETSFLRKGFLRKLVFNISVPSQFKKRRKENPEHALRTANRN